MTADFVHNMVDGGYRASFLVSTEVGIANTIAVVLHEVPQEIGDFGLLFTRVGAEEGLLWNFFSALSAFSV